MNNPVCIYIYIFSIPTFRPKIWNGNATYIKEIMLTVNFCVLLS